MDKIVCLGKNYLDHAKELGDAVPDKPVIFLKPPSVLRSVDTSGTTLTLRMPPKEMGSLHHEAEIVVRIKKGGYRISAIQAREQIDALTLGLDMTLRDHQAELKKNGHPWTTGKVFPDAAVVGPWVPPSRFADYANKEFTFLLGGKVRQRGTANQMTMKIESAIEYASQFFPLCDGDLLFTGTPAGVGPVVAGDRAMMSWGELHYAVVWQ